MSYDSAAQHFCCFSFATGEAANNWIALMDKFLTLGDSQEKKGIMNKILRLVDIYYIALDAAKKGVKVNSSIRKGNEQ